MKDERLDVLAYFLRPGLGNCPLINNKTHITQGDES
jgi:hypothetical protein